jgi:hypothetical protein
LVLAAADRLPDGSSQSKESINQSIAGPACSTGNNSKFKRFRPTYETDASNPTKKT